jgi:hypothetical protein
MHELLRMNDDAPWERSFQFRPFAVDVFGAYGLTLFNSSRENAASTTP